MIDQLIAMALRFRVAVVGGTLLLIGAGAWALTTINLDAFPDLTPNQVEVLTAAPGLSPNEVENLVSYPLETAMMGLPRTQGVRSLSKAGISVVTIAFEDDVEIFFARAQVQQRMQEAAEALPQGLHPTLAPAATPMGEIFQYLVESDSASLMELNNLQEYTIKPLLRTIPGVADVNTWGGMVQQFHVDIDPNRLAGYGLTLDDVAGALAENNGNFGAGYVETRGERLTIRGLGRVTNETRYRQHRARHTSRRHAHLRARCCGGDHRSDAARRCRVARRPRRSARGQDHHAQGLQRPRGRSPRRGPPGRHQTAAARRRDHPSVLQPG